MQSGSAMSGDMKQAMQASSQQLMSMQSTGNTDRDFASMMRAHHQGAIDMAQAELANGKDQQMRRMTQKIMKNNQKEMAPFDKWLAGKQSSAKKQVIHERHLDGWRIVSERFLIRESGSIRN